MAHPKQNAPLPPFLTLTDGTIIRLTAYDQATGAQDAGVVISGVSFTIDQEAAPVAVDAPGVGPQYFPGGGSEQ